jgi:Na+/H+ antiporter NhaD/arsenite permease-like protein
MRLSVRTPFWLIILAGVVLSIGVAFAGGSPLSDGHGGAGAHGNLGVHLPLWTCIPFAGMLLSIALLPLIVPTFWHHHFNKVSFGWALIFALPFLIAYRGQAIYEILHILLADYLPFIILLWSLYTVSGGILLRGTLRGTPLVNTGILLLGTVLASWMGTTGAAMLLIRPFLRANDYRKNRTFMVVFFIFLVANIGGALTPLGDPPLFLGFLHGVSFFWTFNILPHQLVVVAVLLVVYFLLDTVAFRRENVSPPEAGTSKTPLKLEGVHNFLFLGGIVGCVLMSGVVDWGEITTLGIHRAVQDWTRDILLVVLGFASLLSTSPQLRQDNDFTWFPIVEVAYLFVGIFITMIPCLLILKAGSDGAMAVLINSVRERGALLLGDRGALQLSGQRPHLPDLFQHRPGGLLPRHGREPGRAASDDRKRHLPQGHIGRGRFFRCLQLHRQRAQFHGAVHCRGGGYPHAEFFRLYSEIHTGVSDPLLRVGDAGVLLVGHCHGDGGIRPWAAA